MWLLSMSHEWLTGETAKGQICPFVDPVIPVTPFDRLRN
jgi:hypothetical protein